MPIIATSKKGQSADYEPVPAGTHFARCYSVIHIGTVDMDYQGEKKQLNKVRITWELPSETRAFNEKDGEQPMSVSKEYSLSTHEKSTLRKDLDSWRSKAMTDEEAASFDVSKLAGVPAMLTVVHEKSADGTRVYAKVAGVSPLPKGMTMPAQVNPSRVVDYAENWDEDWFGSAPQWLREKMEATPEYAAMREAKLAAHRANDGAVPGKLSRSPLAPKAEEIDISDVPF